MRIKERLADRKIELEALRKFAAEGLPGLPAEYRGPFMDDIQRREAEIERSSLLVAKYNAAIPEDRSKIDALHADEDLQDDGFLLEFSKRFLDGSISAAEFYCGWTDAAMLSTHPGQKQ